MIERHVTNLVVELLAHMRVVCVVGARQVGKTTLVTQIANDIAPSSIVTLDNESVRSAAGSDPGGFIARMSPMAVIDEVQRAPDLMLAIKERVDTAKTPGQFLLTGSANMMLLGTVPDTLPGRVAYVRLRALSQSEIEGRRSSLIDSLFDGKAPDVQVAEHGIQPYLDRIISGGYPEAIEMPDQIRNRFFQGYVNSLVNRDVDDVARVSSHHNLQRVLKLVAARSAGVLNVTAVGRDVGIDDKTARRYVHLLEGLFLIERLPAWSRNINKRQTKMPKVVVSDTALLAHLTGINAARLRDDMEGRLVGSFFETFAVNELAKLADLATAPVELFHYRDRDDRKIDLILERHDGDLVAIEVKASATVRPSDFRHSDFLAKAVGEQLRAAVVLYAGKTTVQFGPRKFAIPLAALWR